MSGALIAVVGPSGAGKDAVIDCAREHYAGDTRVIFPRRFITRSAGAGEDHEPVSEAEFAARAIDGGFVLRWDAHGLCYGIPESIAASVRDGFIAVVNVSRAVVGDLETTFPCARVVRVTVSDEVRRARILARGRETSAGALARLNRADPAPGEPVDLEIINDGLLSDAGDALVGFMEDVLAERVGQTVVGGFR